MQVDLIDLGIGNVRSVNNLLKRLNIAVRQVSDPSMLTGETIFIPGVGNAGQYFSRFYHLAFDSALKSAIERGSKVVGICLGFQLLTHSSEEDGGTQGLGFIDAYTRRLQHADTHNGWESFEFDRRLLAAHDAFSRPPLSRKHLVSGRVFYNHEYGVQNYDTEAYSIPISDSLSDYSAVLVKKNIVGIQFHPEKSQTTGMELLKQVLTRN